MDIKNYVEEILSIPMTRIGFKYVVEAIELVLDTQDYKFYLHLAKIHNTTTRAIEKAMRVVKDMSLTYIDDSYRLSIFGAEDPSVTEYVIKATEYYRRNYEEKES